jgi:hypothetical protein
MSSHRYSYKGYIIWKFDGYYDVHETVDGHPVAEGLSTATEAKAFINDARWFRAFETGSIKMRVRS